MYCLLISYCYKLFNVWFQSYCDKVTIMIRELINYRTNGITACISNVSEHIINSCS